MRQCATSAVLFGTGDIIAQQVIERKRSRRDVSRFAFSRSLVDRICGKFYMLRRRVNICVADHSVDAPVWPHRYSRRGVLRTANCRRLLSQLYESDAFYPRAPAGRRRTIFEWSWLERLARARLHVRLWMEMAGRSQQGPLEVRGVGVGRVEFSISRAPVVDANLA